MRTAPLLAMLSAMSSALLLAWPAFAASPRALFDNLHAETAGNADWIIDTDQPLPVPAQSTVGPATPRNYWLGAISSYAIDLVKRGYFVATLSAPNAITYGDTTKTYDLSKFDVFIVPEPNTKFAAAESTAIFNFVREGGGLIAIGDHDVSDRNNDGFDSPKIWNLLDAQKRWGVHWQSTGEANRNFSQDSGNVEASPADSIIHGPEGVADSLSFHGGTSFVLDPVANPRVRGLVWMNGFAHGTTGVMAARSEYGSGRIVFCGDSSPVDDGSAQPGNSSIFDGWGEVSGRDSLFFLNATRWATRRTIVLDAPGASSWRLALAPPRPNPSSGTITLGFTLPAAGRVSLEIVDLTGRRVRLLASDTLAAGAHAVAWDGRDGAGRRMAPGVYLARLVTPEGQRTRRLARVH